MFQLAAAFPLVAAAPVAEPPESISRLEATRLIAGCVIARDRPQALLIASSEPSTPAFDKAARRLEPALVGCLTPVARSLTIRINDLRGVFAETFLKEANGAALERARALPALPAQRIIPGKSEAANDAALFRCTVAAEPLQSVLLVKATPASSEEVTAFRALAPALQQCVPQDAAMHLKPFQVRLLVAAALWGRLAAVPGA